MADLGYGIDNKRAVRAAKRAQAQLSAKINSDMLMMKKSIASLEKKIISDMAKLELSPNGLLIGPRVNLKQAQKLHTAMTYQFEEIYGKAITKHVKGYKEVGDWVIENFKDLDFAADWTDVDLTMIQQLQKQAALGFVQLGNAAKTSVQQALYNNIAAQAPFEDLVGTISAALTGKYSTSGKPLSQYATMYANDGIMNFYNSVHLQKGEDLGIEHYLYSGTIMSNTRDFCRRRAQRVFSLEEINSWTFKWTGKSGPALTHRGGWNCRHHWQAVRPEWVPELEEAKEERSIIAPTKADVKRAQMAGGLSVGDLSKQQKAYINKIGIKLKKDIMTDKTALLNHWGLLSDEAKLIKINEWQAKGYIGDTVPAYLKAGKPGEQITTWIPKKKRIPKKKKIPTKVTDPEQIITGTISATPAEAEVIAAIDDGVTWKQLTSVEKNSIGKMGKKMNLGKKLNLNSKEVQNWNKLSIETQQMKLNQWKAKGWDINPNLPIKGPGKQAGNIIEAAIKEGNEKFAAQVGKSVDDLDFDSVAKKFDERWQIQDIDYTTYNKTTGAQLFQNVDEELERLSDSFPNFQQLFADKDNIKSFSIIESNVVSDSALGVYSDTNWTLKIAGKLPKKHSSLNLIGKADDLWQSTSAEFYGTMRHEIGHHIDNVIRTQWKKGFGWNHQDEWRKIYKSFDQKDWRKIFGRYTSTDKYEGFAEAFKIYTSPKYKAGVLPQKIEKYLNKMLGGGPIKEKVKESIARSTLPKVFKKKSLQERYEQIYAEIASKPTLTEKQAQGLIKVRCKNIIRSLQGWQGSTQGYAPSAMKLRWAQILDEPNIKWLASTRSGMGTGKAAQKVATMAANDFVTDEFIWLRAITQSYYDKKGIKTVKMWRGTSGTAGKKMKKIANDAKLKVSKEKWGSSFVEVEESSLNGWSTKESVANQFRAGGVYTEEEVAINDVFMSRELWPTKRYKQEYEWIITRRTNQRYPLNKINSGFSSKEEFLASQTKNEAWEKAAEAAKSWQKKKPSVLKSHSDVEESVLHYINQKILKLETKGDLEKVLKKIDEKVAGIKKAIEEGKDVTIVFGKKVDKKMVDELLTNFEIMKYHIEESIQNGAIQSIIQTIKEFDTVNIFGG